VIVAFRGAVVHLLEQEQEIRGMSLKFTTAFLVALTMILSLIAIILVYQEIPPKAPIKLWNLKLVMIHQNGDLKTEILESHETQLDCLNRAIDINKVNIPSILFPFCEESHE
jgi:hypothetical protein